MVQGRILRSQLPRDVDGRNAARRQRHIAVPMSPTRKDTHMPKAEGPVYREILHAGAKLNGKPVRWIVGVFANETALRSFLAILNIAYKTGMKDIVAGLDVHSPAKKPEDELTEVKFSRQVIQYNPAASLPDDDAALV
jgi:hypothetical protein